MCRALIMLSLLVIPLSFISAGTPSGMGVDKGLPETVTVTDEHGQPVAGAAFSLRMLNHEDGIRSKERYGGSLHQRWARAFRTRRSAAGRGSITLDSATLDTWEQAAPQAIELPAKEPITVRVSRLALHAVSGRVVDAHHHSLAGVTVTCSVTYRQGVEPTMIMAMTGADGSYQLANIPAGRTVSLLYLEAGRFSSAHERHVAR